MTFSSILSKVGKFFVGIFSKSIPTLIASAKAELATVEQAVIVFAATDLGKLAIDAVGMAATAGQTGDAAFAAAKAKFIADAKGAGHDLETIGNGIVDWMIQTAYTFVAGTFANISTVTPPTA